ncbi:hypothetical protein [Eubacterium callanderi]|uniref:hypothetical protein n=1 Tax=Eubacterium callanderi TaxID=53442 RepID=UPI0011603158|nr:hypothetical protein [Eubacterium callanderi]MBU5305708.1 hypothetical protein [Eubacterium callanderi]
MEYNIFTKKELLEIFPFGETKLNKLLNTGVLPVVKVGRDYTTNQERLNQWFKKMKVNRFFINFKAVYNRIIK